MPRDYPYSPAFISTISAPEGHTELVVFPLRGKAFKIPIHSASGNFTYSPDGKSLYGQCNPFEDATKIALCKVDLQTARTTPVPDSWNPLRSAVSNRPDRIVDRLYGLTFPDGKFTTILLQHPDKYRWTYLSLSPDGERAVATHHGRVELIDIVRGTTELLDDRFFMASWSPDGKWLAAVENGEKGRTILMDAKDLATRRILGSSELDWSPDSRYLLGVTSCGPYYGTLQIITIETGERTTIKSSECQVNQATTGWVRSDLSKK